MDETTPIIAPETVEPVLEQMMHKSVGLVTVLEKGKTLTRVRDDHDDEFSVKTTDLIPYKTITGTGTYDAFAAMIQLKGYTLTAELHDEKELEETEAEYHEWTGGEALPEDCVKLYPDKPGTRFWREWCLSFKFDFTTDCPFNLVREGTGGGGVGASRTPVGIVHKNGKVTVRYSSIIEKLIRIGLRAQKG